MLNQEFKARLSPKLLVYIDKIERETGRKTHFEYIDDFGSPGAQFAFRKDPTYLWIAAKSGISFDDPRIERSFAHEITHCFLIYSLGYYGLDAIDNSSDEDILQMSLLGFIDDIVVNKIIQDNGFIPYSDTYFNNLKQEIKAAKLGGSVYGQSGSRLYDKRYPISRYIMAWAGIKYYDLTPDSRKLINEFLKVFPLAFPEAFQKAKSLRETIIKNDVFTVNGHKEAIQFMLKDWELEDRCSFKSYKA